MSNENYYRFELGDFECVCISDGGYNYPPQNFFTNVSKDQVEELLRQKNLPTDYVWTPYTYLYVNTGEHRVLVDMGAGNLFPTTGKLLQNMQAAGIAPTSVDSVFITHAHPDHIGGTLDEEGNPVYVNAQYFIWKDEWEFWFSEAVPEKVPEQFITLARKNLEPIQDRMNLVDNESNALPGIHMIAAPGHTPGHAVVSFSSDGEELLYIGDTVLYPFHLDHLDWLSMYDILPEKADPSKHKIFDYAVEKNAWVIGQHFPPFPSLGHIAKKDDGWQWQPVEVVENL